MNKEDADQESFCSDSDDAGTSDSNTIAADSSLAPSQHHRCYSGYSTRGLLCAQRLEMEVINTRNSILTVAVNRGLCLSGVTVQQVHTFVAGQAGLI